ncbi:MULTISPECIES: DUF397 domain-containing protein [unclassified Streptomyces]|uniref:DUF397 domain-containing protein n=1 Tax=unclassified Streptomyces TaxID=2593676 RepID=UPI002E182CD6|nr:MULTISPECIES: DUF397 domain-containing protein [unclassified Streptomyces]
MREYDLSKASWRKSSYSNGEGGNCVEVAYDFVGAARGTDGVAGVVPVRDSKVPDGHVVVIGAAAWAAFVTGTVRPRG